MSTEGENPIEKKIIVTEDGPYFVLGGLLLVHKMQVVSECGEPLAWKTEGARELGECYVLCRCGNSHEKPFCDGTHCKVEFDGRETADTRPTAERQVVLPGSEKIIVRRDQSLCSKSGFCGNRLATIDQLVLGADDPNLRSQVIAMVERCPSGAADLCAGGGRRADRARPAAAGGGDHRHHLAGSGARRVVAERGDSRGARRRPALRDSQPGDAVLLREIGKQAAVRWEASRKAWLRQ